MSYGKHGLVEFQNNLPGSRQAAMINDFLKNIIRHLCTQTCAFFDAYEGKDHHLRYPAHYLQALLAAAVSRVTPVCLSKVDVRIAPGHHALKRDMPVNGDLSADLWCYHHKHDFLIQYTRSLFNPEDDTFNSGSTTQWQQLVTTLTQLEQETVHWQQTPICLGLMITLICLTTLDKKYGEHFNVNTVIEQLEPAPSWWATWRPPPEMRLVKIKAEKPFYEYIPAILFVTHLG